MRESALGLGLYSIPETGRILHVEPERVRRWVEGYTSKRRDQVRYHSPLLKRRLTEKGILTFKELVELLFVCLFLNEGVSLQAIREAAEVAAREFNADYPFTLRRFDTDGRTIFATAHEEGILSVEDLRKSQYVFRSFTPSLFKKLDFDEKFEAARYWPLGKQAGVLLDPRFQFGQPIVEETGTPTDALYDCWRANHEDIDVVASWYRVGRRSVEHAISFERQLRAA